MLSGTNQTVRTNLAWIAARRFVATVCVLVLMSSEVPLLLAAEQKAATTGAELRLEILSPEDGAIVNDRSVTIKGLLFGPLDAGVSINSRPVTLFEQPDRRSFALAVPLSPGESAITVAASRASGATVSKVLEVVRRDPPAFGVTVARSSGIAPVEVMFEIAQYEEGEISETTIDLDGDGSVDITRTEDERYIPAQYSKAGVFEARVAIKTTAGQTINFTIPITVLTQAQVDRQAQRIWKMFGDALRAGDAGAALTLLTASSARRYAPVLEQSEADLRKMGESFGPISFVSGDGGVLTYAASRRVEGQEQGLIVTFMQTHDGVWRLAL